ncbi:MAG: hypothetical protein KatS3mg109_0168 [Pirellulaceae bacterium]|nr:MAG: hypothetical protein KatS3mg109_0168 [Pirellulaceae bacterium]
MQGQEGFAKKLVRILGVSDCVWFVDSELRGACICIGGPEQALQMAMSFISPKLDTIQPGGYKYRVVTNSREIARLMRVCIETHSDSSPMSLEPSVSLSGSYWALLRAGVQISSVTLDKGLSMVAKDKGQTDFTYDLFGLGTVVFSHVGGGKLAFKSFFPVAGMEAMVESALARATGQEAAPILHDSVPTEEDTKAIVESLAPAAKGPPKTKADTAERVQPLDPVDEQSPAAENYALTEEIDNFDFYDEIEDEPQRPAPEQAKNDVIVNDEPAKERPTDQVSDDVRVADDSDDLTAEDIGQVEKPERRKPISDVSIESQYSEEYWKSKLKEMLPNCTVEEQRKISEKVNQIKALSPEKLVALCDAKVSKIYPAETAKRLISEGHANELVWALGCNFAYHLLKSKQTV